MSDALPFSYDPARLCIDDVKDYIKKALSTFVLDKKHDPNGVYFHICTRVAENLRVKGKEDDVENGFLSTVIKAQTAGPKHQTVGVDNNGLIQSRHIWTNPTDSLLAVAAVHSLFDHAGINTVESKLHFLKFGMSSTVKRTLPSYCITCSLRKVENSYGTNALECLKTRVGMDDVLTTKGSRKNEGILSSYMDLSTGNSGHPSDSVKAEFKNTYMGALLDSLLRKGGEGCTNIVYVGFLHFGINKDVLFSVDNDTGILKTIRVMTVENKLSDAHVPGSCRAGEDFIEQALHALMRSAVSSHSKLMNLNIAHFRFFAHIPCPTFHWRGSWVRKVPHLARKEPTESLLPDVVAAALQKFLHVLKSPEEMQQVPFWQVPKNQWKDELKWFKIVTAKYEETQWLESSNPHCRMSYNYNRGPRPVLIVDHRCIPSCVVVSDSVMTHVCKYYLRSFDKNLDQYAFSTLDKTDEYMINRPRRAFQYFNFQLVESDPQDRTLEHLIQSMYRVTITDYSIKILLYIYVYMKQLPTSNTNCVHAMFRNMDTIMSSYWDYFKDRAADFIQGLKSEFGEETDMMSYESEEPSSYCESMQKQRFLDSLEILPSQAKGGIQYTYEDEGESRLEEASHKDVKDDMTTRKGRADSPDDRSKDASQDTYLATDGDGEEETEKAESSSDDKKTANKRKATVPLYHSPRKGTRAASIP
ncbi:hypothetical protein TRICI_004442 [Trichomonascus ciferrii]|uniref:Uncharacterized protein n=1 Tax=Trichomonascus ciferrii TaxID=44093 RepID=A0A642V0L7_9ASCO|nr:hypothetical protein TRICI_004442 [Trichomonascus ciferrii]